MHVEIVEQGESLYYVVRDAKGRETQKGDLPRDDLIAQARREKKSLRYVAEREAQRRLGSAATIAPATVAVVEVAQPEAGTMGLEELYGHFAPREHDHDLPEHDHPHRHDNLEEAYVAIDGRHEETKARVAVLEAENAELKARLAEHRHRPLEERLASLEATQDAQTTRLAAVESRPVVSPHAHEEYVTAEGVAEQLAAVRKALTALDGATAERLNLLSQRLSELQEETRGVALRTDVLDAEAVEALVRRVIGEVPRGRYTVEEISSQRKGGKRRFVVEEV